MGNSESKKDPAVDAAKRIATISNELKRKFNNLEDNVSNILDAGIDLVRSIYHELDTNKENIKTNFTQLTNEQKNLIIQKLNSIIGVYNQIFIQLNNIAGNNINIPVNITDDQFNDSLETYIELGAWTQGITYPNNTLSLKEIDNYLIGKINSLKVDLRRERDWFKNRKAESTFAYYTIDIFTSWGYSCSSWETCADNIDKFIKNDLCTLIRQVNSNLSKYESGIKYLENVRTVIERIFNNNDILENPDAIDNYINDELSIIGVNLNSFLSNVVVAKIRND